VQRIGWRLPLKIDVGEKRPRLGKMHVVAGAFRAQGHQVFIEAGRFGQVASELGGLRRPIERVQAVRFHVKLSLKLMLRLLQVTPFKEQLGQ
jgi:hypothetical protein